MKTSEFAGQKFKWDSKAVLDAVGRVKAEALRYTALDIQRTSKRSMKKTKQWEDHSKPGQAPFAHTGALKNSIRFAWDDNARAVVIGAIKYKGQSEGAKALEHGGEITIKVPQTVTQKTVDQRKERGKERGYFASGKSWITKDKKRRGLPVIPAEQERHIREYYKGGNANEKTVMVTKRVKMKERPAMNPALQKEVQKMPERLKRAAGKFKK